MKSSHLCIVLALSIGAPVYAQSAGNSSGKIRLNEAYIHASCALARASSDLPDVTDSSLQKMKEAFERRTALEEKYKDALSRPYPPELEDYVPAPFEYVEHLFTGLPCEEGLWTEAKMPAGFRCRLDRMVFRDPVRKQELKAEGGDVRFLFIYDDEDGKKTEDMPRPLKAGAPRIAGSILVRGQMEGKPYTLVREELWRKLGDDGLREAAYRGG